ncbi:MAG: hypothetical protein WC342_08515 [Methanoregula sp.]|jgi:hypothetical protein
MRTADKRIFFSEVLVIAGILTAGCTSPTPLTTPDQSCRIREALIRGNEARDILKEERQHSPDQGVIRRRGDTTMNKG